MEEVVGLGPVPIRPGDFAGFSKVKSFATKLEAIEFVLYDMSLTLEQSDKLLEGIRYDVIRDCYVVAWNEEN